MGRKRKSSTSNGMTSTGDAGNAGVNLWKGMKVISAKSFTKEMVHQLFMVADEMQGAIHGYGEEEEEEEEESRKNCNWSKITGYKDRPREGPCTGRVLACLFYEPSTRTSCSFAAAMMRLGGSVLNVNAESSSVKKGETLEDTVMCLESYSDAIVLRHPEMGSSARAAKVLSIPLFNAGDGVGEHPTQALLDIYTMKSTLPKDLKSTNIVLLGDLVNGRTVHSLVHVLPLWFENFELHLVSPPQLKMPKEVLEVLLKEHPSIKITEHSDLSSCLSVADVLYVTRIQKERFQNEQDYLAVKGSFVVNKQLLDAGRAKQSLVILHPLPRVDEISTDVDSDPRAVYFKQMKYGMFVRMALIALALDDVPSLLL